MAVCPYDYACNYAVTTCEDTLIQVLITYTYNTTVMVLLFIDLDIVCI